MKRQITTYIAIAYSIALILLVIFGILVTVGYWQNQSYKLTHSFQHFILFYVCPFVLGTTARCRYKQANFRKQSTINRIKNNGKISIFEGRSAVRNLAIFHVLVAEGPLSIGDIQRRLNKISGLEVTYYASLNKRIHALVRGDYIGEVKPAAGKATGLKVCQYEIRSKFYLAYYLNGRSREEILSRLNEPNAAIILSELVNADVNYA
jgi:DNA-binding transcriptional ArsR family regulator